jgi:hypothetical protein
VVDFIGSEMFYPYNNICSMESQLQLLQEPVRSSFG